MHQPRALNPVMRTILCRGIEGGSGVFDLSYDTLVIAVGAVSNTFNVPGVAEHALFLQRTE